MKLCFHVPKQTRKKQGAACSSACVLNRMACYRTAMCPLKISKSTHALHQVPPLEEETCYKITITWVLLFSPLFNLILLNNNKKKVSAFQSLAIKQYQQHFCKTLLLKRIPCKNLLNSGSDKQGCIAHLFQSTNPALKLVDLAGGKPDLTKQWFLALQIPWAVQKKDRKYNT